MSSAGDNPVEECGVSQYLKRYQAILGLIDLCCRHLNPLLNVCMALPTRKDGMVVFGHDESHFSA